jgi:hypothetical protein
MNAAKDSFNSNIWPGVAAVMTIAAIVFAVLFFLKDSHRSTSTLCPASSDIDWERSYNDAVRQIQCLGPYISSEGINNPSLWTHSSTGDVCYRSPSPGFPPGKDYAQCKPGGCPDATCKKCIMCGKLVAYKYFKDQNVAKACQSPNPYSDTSDPDPASLYPWKH